VEQGRGKLRGRTAAEIDRVECGMWNVECGMWSVEGGRGSVSQFHFLAEGSHIVVHPLMLGGGVESTVDAPAFAKRKMDIETCHFLLFGNKITNKFKKNTPFRLFLLLFS
jgi:hypothetical protein